MAKLSTDELLDAFKEMTLLELSEFVKQFEDTFDVTAAAPVAVAAAAPAGGGGEGVEGGAVGGHHLVLPAEGAAEGGLDDFHAVQVQFQRRRHLFDQVEPDKRLAVTAENHLVVPGVLPDRG